MISTYVNDVQRRTALNRANKLMTLINSVPESIGIMDKCWYSWKYERLIKKLLKVMYPTFYRKSFYSSRVTPSGDVVMDVRLATAATACELYSYFLCPMTPVLRKVPLIQFVDSSLYETARMTYYDLDYLTIAPVNEPIRYSQLVHTLKNDRMARISILFTIWSFLNTPDNDGRYACTQRSAEALSLIALAYLRVSSRLDVDSSKGFYYDQTVIEDLPILHRVEDIFRECMRHMNVYRLTIRHHSLLFSRIIFSNNISAHPLDSISLIRKNYYSDVAGAGRRIDDFVKAWRNTCELDILRRIAESF